MNCIKRSVMIVDETSILYIHNISFSTQHGSRSNSSEGIWWRHNKNLIFNSIRLINHHSVVKQTSFIVLLNSTIYLVCPCILLRRMIVAVLFFTTYVMLYIHNIQEIIVCMTALSI